MNIEHCDTPYHRDFHDCCAKRCGRGIASLIGRILIGLVFLLGAAYAIIEWDKTVGDVMALNLRFPKILVAVGIVLQVLGGLSLIFGYKTRVGALLLIIFLVPVTLLFHSFWAVPADQVVLATQDFIRNVYYLGALLLVLAFGPGRFSVDACICCKHLCAKNDDACCTNKDTPCH